MAIFGIGMKWGRRTYLQISTECKIPG